MSYFKINLKLLQWWGWNRCQIYLQCYYFWEYVDICLHSRTSQSDAAHSVKVLVSASRSINTFSVLSWGQKYVIEYSYFERVNNWSLILNFPRWMGTEHVPSNGNASDLYLGRSRFESRPEYCLSWMMYSYFVVSSFSPGKCWSSISN
jgi:hypothetical protein